MQYKKLAWAMMALGVSSAALAEVMVLDEVSVQGESIDTATQRVYAPTLRQQGATLGEALAGQLGVHNSQFGAGAGTPVVRGQTGYRNQIINNGIDVIDMAQTSPDHAIMVNSVQAEHIDVIDGVDKLHYGTGMTGALIAVHDGISLNKQPSKALQGEVGVRLDSVNDEKLASLKGSANLGMGVALHAQGLVRKVNDYRVPRYDDEHEGQLIRHKSVPNTAVQSRLGRVGLSWAGQRGFVSLSYGDRQDKYGLPGHSEEYHSCHTHLGKSDGMELHCGHHDHDHGHNHGNGHQHGHSHGHDHDHEEAHEHHDPMVDLRHKSYDLKASIYQPLTGIERVDFVANQTRYQHDEVEGDEPMSFFRNKGTHAHLTLAHTPWRGLAGSFGVHYGQNTMSITGQEALLRETASKRLGVFATERLRWQNVALQFGARAEQHNINTSHERLVAFGRGHYKKTTYGYGASADWYITPKLVGSVGFLHQERVPNALELYARGLHLASNTYEWGDDQYDRVLKNLKDEAYAKVVQQHGESRADFEKRLGADKRLDKEKSNNFELGLGYQDDQWAYTFKGFYKNYDGYIYARTLDKMENFRLIRYAQADANFYGIEGMASYALTPAYHVQGFGDYVRGKIGHDNAPRVPAARLGARVLADFGLGFTGSAEYVRTFAQRDVADFEQPTQGHHLVNMGLNYQGQNANYQVFFKANNLLNQAIYSHASFLPNVPQAGRSFSVGVNYQF